MGFEPATPVLERAKTVRVSDRAAALEGHPSDATNKQKLRVF
jgi:hypothetical protein